MSHVKACVRCSAGDAESVTWTSKLNVPTAVGQPEKQPLDWSVKPAGSAPVETVQVRVPTPLLALRQFGVHPTIPMGIDVVVIPSALSMLIDRTFTTLWPDASVALTAKLK